MADIVALLDIRLPIITRIGTRYGRFGCTIIVANSKITDICRYLCILELYNNIILIALVTYWCSIPIPVFVRAYPFIGDLIAVGIPSNKIATYLLVGLSADERSGERR